MTGKLAKAIGIRDLLIMSNAKEIQHLMNINCLQHISQEQVHLTIQPLKQNTKIKPNALLRDTEI
jgi:hypothetical protein